VIHLGTCVDDLEVCVAGLEADGFRPGRSWTPARAATRWWGADGVLPEVFEPPECLDDRRRDDFGTA
jgi:hypothetical protein